MYSLLQHNILDYCEIMPQSFGRFDTKHPENHGHSSVWLQPDGGQSQERLEKRKIWLLTFGCVFCWNKTSDLGGAGKYEHKETTEQSKPSGYHTHLLWAGKGDSCFLHLSVDEKIMPSPYPKILACRMLHRDKVVSPQSAPLRSGNLGSLSKTQ